MASGIFNGLFYYLLFVYLASSFVGLQTFVQGRFLLVSKPDPDNAAATARWLVSQNSWGTLRYNLDLRITAVFDSTLVHSFLIYIQSGASAFWCLIELIPVDRLKLSFFGSKFVRGI